MNLFFIQKKSPIINKITLLFYLLIISIQSTSQIKPIIEKIITAEKNNYTEIYALEIDNKGIVYLATNNGLFIYNGNKIIPFNNSLLGSEYEYVNFYKEDSCTIWGIPYNGYLIQMKCNGVNSEYTLFKTPKKSNLIWGLIKKNNLVQFIGESTRININKQTNRIVYQIDNQHSNINITNFIYEDFFENIHITKEFYKKIYNIGPYYIRIVNNNNLLINEEVYLRQNNEIIKIFDAKKCGLKGTLLNFRKSKDGGFLFCLKGESKGAYYFKNNKLICYYYEDDVTAITEDKWGNIYFSAKNKGLFVIRHTDNQAENNILSIKKPFTIKQIIPNLKNNSLWVNDKQGNLFAVDQKITKYSQLISTTSSLTSILQSQFDKVTFTNTNFYFSINNNLQKIDLKKYVSSTAFKTFKDKDTLYICNKNEVDKLVAIRNKLLLIKLFRFQNSLYDACFINSSILLMSNNGIYQIKNNILQKKITNSILDSSKITYCTTNNNLLFCISENGIFEIDLLSQKVNQLLITNRNSSTFLQLIPFNNLLYCIDQKGYTLIDLSGKIINTYKIPNFNLDKRILGAYILNNKLCLYNQESIFEYSIASTLKDNYQPILNFNKLEYNEKNIIPQTDSIIRLRYYSKNTLHFGFDILNSNEAIEKVINYILIEEKDTIINQNIQDYEINLHKLAPANYKLFIFLNLQLLKKVDITILPLWYQTWWFKLFILFSALFSILFFSWLFYKHKLNIKNKTLLAQIHLLQLESSSRLNQIKPHFIFNALMPLQKYILNSENKKSLDYLNQFSILVRDMLNISRNETINLYDEIKYISNFLQIQQHEKNYSFEFSINKNIIGIESINTLMPSLICQPLVENAVDYGINSSTEMGSIELKFNKVNNCILLFSVIDNGKGFDYSTLKSIQHKELHALQIIEERLKLLNPNNQHPIRFIKHSNSFEVQLTIPIKTTKHEN